MATFFMVLVVLLLVVLAMSVGVIMGRKPIAGSCGGMKSLGMDVACDICGGDQTLCEKENARVRAESANAATLGYDATKTR